VPTGDKTNWKDQIRPFLSIPEYKKLFVEEYIPFFFRGGAKVVLVLGWESYAVVEKVIKDVFHSKLKCLSLGEGNDHLKIFAEEVLHPLTHY